MRVAVVGAGISGLAAAYTLGKAGVDVVLYEKEDYLGGHAKTAAVDGVDVDLGFMVFNRVTYPNMMEFFESLGVDMEISDMSFSVSLDEGRGCEWGSRNGLSSLFAQKSNAVNPYFWQMIREIVRFKEDVLKYLEEHESNPEMDRDETLEHFLKSHGYSELFQKAYLIPICASVWSCPSEGVLCFSAFSVLSFCRNHHALQLFGRPQWLTVKSRSHNYVEKVKEELESKSCQIRAGCAVQSVLSLDEGCCVVCEDNSEEIYDGCIIGVHAPNALKILGPQATHEESRILGAFQYVNSDIYLHRDKSLMPRNPSAWSAWNFLGTTDGGMCVTYWLNIIQNLGDTGLPCLVTLNPSHVPEHTVLKWSTSHPFPTVAASKASLELESIQGKRRIWFCGAYQGYGFHEDGLKAGIVAAKGLLGKECFLLKNPRHMVPSLMESGARLIVTRFLDRYISTGFMTLLEEGGTMYTFGGTNKKCCTKSVLRVHDPLFYWKIAAEADLGLADAYINGYFSFVDEKEGLLNLLMILIANKDLMNTSSNHTKRSLMRGWWTPMFLTSSLASAKYILRHISRQNTITQARRNISQHYDLSNELFSLFLDDTMTYSCAIFKSETEDLKVAQMRKISALIEKARIGGKHEVLEIGCGWGALAIEVVKRTGCKYTGITLSKEQLKYCKEKAKEVGLEDHMSFMLCDYRQVPNPGKYDRIISCEMIEAVGHEYMEEFFGCCEFLLAEDGIFVLQSVSIPDGLYDEFRRSPGFIKEYIFPGGCLPSLSRLISAMASTSRLCVEHLENIGIHYYQTLIYWRRNFMANKSKILALGFDEKFIRTWEYYFIYCAAGFRSRTLGDYQVTYPNMMEFFESLGVDMEISDMSFSVSLDQGRGYEWGSRNGLSSLFAQKSNAINPYFWQMIREIVRFKEDVLKYLEEHESNPEMDRDETLEHFLKSHGYSELFQKAYLIPICASIWSCPSGVLCFSAFSVLSFCRNHRALQLFGRPQWLTVKSRSHKYVEKVKEELESKPCQIRTGCAVQSVLSLDEGCCVVCEDNSEEIYDGCIIGVHAPNALKILGPQATHEESRILGAFQYVHSDIYLHRDKSLMPRNPSAWSAWNFLGTTDGGVCLTFWLNIIQNLGDTGLPCLVTLNPSHVPEHTVLKWSTSRPFPTVAASKASLGLESFQGKRRIWFCGAYQGYGFHEDGLKAGIVAAKGLLGKECFLLNNPRHMVPSLMESGARLIVTRFLDRYISTGFMMLLEEGGTMYTFGGTNKKCRTKSVLRVHDPLFYWKIATEADLGLEDAYINGYCSFVDEKEGLLNLFMILIANRDLMNASSNHAKKSLIRGWWTPMLLTASLTSAKYILRHISRQNSITQAHRNISQHYDLSNEFFSLFLDDTMTCSCAIFKSETEDLKVAQMRKVSALIKKARIGGKHEVLEIGCGWGALAIEVVKRTGCRYKGITLSKEQLKYCKEKAKEVGLEDHMTFMLCDYRQVPNPGKYDRIISCEMIEAVGHEYMEEFFGCCESLLAEDGIFVLQFISIPDERYDECRRSPDFMKEYIFPGGCLPSLSRLISAMASASRLCVEHLENIGIHYYQTLIYWRRNFVANKSKILALGFDEKFIRTWEYYFIYCAAGFRSRTLGDYQIIFSRPGNSRSFADPYQTSQTA